MTSSKPKLNFFIQAWYNGVIGKSKRDVNLHFSMTTSRLIDDARLIE